MPYTVAVSFGSFLDNIALRGSQTTMANARRDRIVELLRGRFSILEAVPMGSVIRGTALRNNCDLDVIVALDQRHIVGKTPTALLSDVRDALGSYNARLVRRNGQAVTLYFSTWPNVDIVPAARIAEQQRLLHYEIPDATRGVWIKTNPSVHDATIISGPQSKRDLLMMMRAWNRSHSSYLESFHIEALLLALSADANDWSWTVLQAFEQLRKGLNSSCVYPAPPYSQVDSYLGHADRAEAMKRLDTAVSQARDAWWATYGTNSDHARAIGSYRTIFGDKFPAYG